MADGEPLDWKLRLIAWANLAVGGLGLAFGLALILGSLQPPYSETILPWLGPLFIGVTLVWFGPALLIGWGLLARKWWAPGMLVVGSLIQLLAIPVGTIIGLFGLYAVFRNPTKLLEAGERDMRRIDMSANLKAGLRFGAIALIAMAILGAIVGLGYIFRDQIEHWETPNRLVMGLIIGVGALGFWFVAMVFGWVNDPGKLSPQRMLLRRQAEARQKVVVAEHNARLARLAADPATVKYVGLINSGDYWTDEQIAYDRNPDAKATCQHLNYVEQAMRAAHLPVKRLVDKHVQVNCLVDWPELSRRLGQQTQVTFDADVFQGDRYRDEWAESLIRCVSCDSAIHTVHPRDARPGTKKFPAV